MTDAQKIRRLERQLAELDADSKSDIHKKIDVLNDLAWLLRDTDAKRSFSLSNSAYSLSDGSDGNGQLYQEGMAYSLRTQGFLNMRSADYSTGLTQLHKALQIFESLHLDDGLPDVFDGMASIYFYVGDYPQALEMAYKQMDAAQHIGDTQHIANANNVLASIYFAMGDQRQGMDLLKLNLTLAQEIKHDRIECATYIKLSQAYLTAGEYQPALENGLRGLHMSRELGNQIFEIRAHRLLAEYYLQVNDKARTYSHLEKALSLSRKLGTKVFEALVLKTMGIAYREFHQFDRAKEVLNLAVMIAQSIGLNLDLSQCHLLLSELYEELGDSTQALHHYKQYHAIQELVFNENADLRLKVLQVAHDTETAKKEAEIAHLRTVELQQEITKHKQVKLQLQHQVEYEQALAHCSQTLLSVAGSEDSQQQILNQALEHLRVGSQASRAYIYRNIQDPDLGPCLGIVAEACAPNIHPHLSNPDNHKASWSRVPAAIFEALEAGKSVGGPVEKLYATIPRELDMYRNQINPLLSLQLFPIFINDQWWGFVGFDDCVKVRQWGEQEISMLGTASEMIASTLQRWQAEQKVLHQLKYARALSACSQTLLSPIKGEEEYHRLLERALQYLIEPTKAGSIYLFENHEDPEMGFSSRTICRVYASGTLSREDYLRGLPEYREVFLQSPIDDPSVPFQPQTDIIPWSLFPAEIRHQLESGVPAGGLIKDLFKANPLWQKYLLNVVRVRSAQFFPIFIDDHWWGTISFDDRVDEREWHEDEILLLGAAAEMITSSLKLWRAGVRLRQMNERLDQQVKKRTAELSNTIKLLQREINERKQAEVEIQQMVELLEERVADRSRELAALYDMTILFTEAQNLTDILTPALGNLCNNVDGSGIAVHILDADKNQLHLTAQLSLVEWEQMQQVELIPVFADWLRQADAPVMLVGYEEPHPVLPPEVLTSHYRTYFGVALRVHNEVIGLLGVYREQERPFSVQNVSFLITMADQLGIIIQNHRLQEQSRYMTRTLERQRLARELHDSVAQRIYSLNLFARAGQDALADGELEDARQQLRQVEENALYSLREMRLLLYQLRPLALENQTLIDAFEERFVLVERRLGMEAVIEGDIIPELTEDLEEDLYFIITESLNNALKHAQATRVELRFEATNDRLLVTIRDNGRGFDLQQPQPGLGLENMCIRAEKIGGLVEMETAIGQGTVVRISI